MTILNSGAPRHPRTQWEIESCLWRAIEKGAAIAVTANGREIIVAIHDRYAIPAFSFYRNGEDVTKEFLKVLRAQA